MEQEIRDVYRQHLTNAADIHKRLNKKYTLKQIKEVLAKEDVQ